MIDAGYFPKIIEPTPPGMNLPGVREICSVSCCVSGAPDDWVEKWRHNWFGWFNTVDDAWSVVPEAERPRYRLFAYRLALTRWREGEPLDVAVPDDVRPEPISRGFVSRGFDVVSKSMASVLGFECSPLSCNGMGREIAVNEFCLFGSVDEAIEGAKRFSRGGCEPGDYYVIEVLEEPS